MSIARTCESFNSVDGNILCPACMNVTQTSSHCAYIAMDDSKGAESETPYLQAPSLRLMMMTRKQRRRTMLRWNKWMMMTKPSETSSTR